MKKRTKIIISTVLIVVVVIGIFVWSAFGPMIKTMYAAKPDYGDMPDVEIYTTTGEMTPTGFTPSSDPNTYNLMVEQVLNNHSTMLKKATVSAGNGTVYEIMCDEGSMGSDVAQQAPNPLSYMTAGSSMNLFNQLTATANEMDIQIDDMIVEQRVTYREIDVMTENAVGYADDVETAIIIESPEDEATLDAWKEAAIASWEAGEGMGNATQINSYMLVNGEHFTDNYAEIGHTVYTNETDKLVSPSESYPQLYQLVASEDMQLKLFSNDLIFEVISEVHSLDNPDNPYQSVAKTRCNIGGYAAFDITSDDASLYGGESTMPTSLHYFTAGTGLCLMTQMSGAITPLDMEIDDYRVEQMISYNETETTEVETYVAMSSTNTDEVNEKWFNLSLKMCLAGEALKNPCNMITDLYMAD